MSNLTVPVGISNRHIHVSNEDLITLFGEGATLTWKKDLSQIGQYACEEVVTLVGPKGKISGVRILGPCRKQTQVEISRTDSFTLGVNPPVRDSGSLEGSAPLKVIGPNGEIDIAEGCILAKRHIHMNLEEADAFGVNDKDIVSVKTDGERSIVFNEVLIRVNKDFRLEMHIDTDEANAAALKNGDKVTVLK